MKPVSFLFCALVALAAAFATAAEQRPDILFILTDDQTFDAVHALGNQEVQTPNMDRLVAAGTTFTHAYNMGSWVGAVCIASRTMIISGRTVWRAEQLPKDLAVEQQEGHLWPQLMKRAGYATYFAGKWHTGAKPAELFDVIGHVRPGMAKDAPEAYNRPLVGQPDPWSASDPKWGGQWEGGRHWAAVLADEGVDFLGRAAQKPEPFFMYLAFNSPHDPRQSPQDFLDRYPVDKVSVPPSYVPEYPYGDKIGAGRDSRDEKLAPFPRTEFAIKTHRREYFASVTYLDQQVGRILDALEKSGRAKSTYIFFTSDHGLAIGRHGLLGKQNMFDDSLRVPFVVVGPGVARGGHIDAPIYLQDLVPTSLQLAGQAIPAYQEFHSLLPLLRGETKQSAYVGIYAGYRDLQRSITADGFKLVLYPPVPKALLFDLVHDPLEMKDVSDQPENRSRMKRMFAQLLELQRGLADKVDLTGKFAELASP